MKLVRNEKNEFSILELFFKLGVQCGRFNKKFYADCEEALLNFLNKLKCRCLITEISPCFVVLNVKNGEIRHINKCPEFVPCLRAAIIKLDNLPGKQSYLMIKIITEVFKLGVMSVFCAKECLETLAELKKYNEDPYYWINEVECKDQFKPCNSIKFMAF